MICSLEELRHKEAIDITTGERLGYIDDVQLDLSTSEAIALVIYGRYRLFGILGREESVVIPCGDIKVVGSEVILIKRREVPDSAKSTNAAGNAALSLLK